MSSIVDTHTMAVDTGGGAASAAWTPSPSPQAEPYGSDSHTAGIPHPAELVRRPRREGGCSGP